MYRVWLRTDDVRGWMPISERCDSLDEAMRWLERWVREAGPYETGPYSIEVRKETQEEYLEWRRQQPWWTPRISKLVEGE